MHVPAQYCLLFNFFVRACEPLPILARMQTGIVVEVARALDCALSSGELRRGVPSGALRPVLRFQLDQHVLHASGFLGRIDDVRCCFSGPLRCVACLQNPCSSPAALGCSEA
jgi:hypothetical protein